MNFENIKIIYDTIVSELNSNNYPRKTTYFLENMNKLKEQIEEEFPYAFGTKIEIEPLYSEEKLRFQYRVIESDRYGDGKEIVRGIEEIDEMSEDAARIYIQKNMMKYLLLPNINECNKLTKYLVEACVENECGVFAITYAEDISIPGVCENKDEFLKELKLLEEDCKKYEVKEIDIESNRNWVECYAGFPMHFNMTEKE